ncbi:amidase [Agrobacterium vitis]|uniref:amidase n=1 Tax=Agrobacterium vitis TaxID=373 RepID=UPI003D28FA0B
MTDLCWSSAQEIRRLYQARQLSPIELVRHLLDRVGSLDPQVHAFINLDENDVLRQAREAERRATESLEIGPLHGIPIGIKDLIDVEGVPTTCQSKILLENIASCDAEVVHRLRKAGAIIFGKLTCHEFAWGGPVLDHLFPPARNPWNLDHHPGGSSSGSGAALAAGFLPLSVGTDTGGSIRNPAGACGVVGLKPTFGLVSKRGVFPMSFSLDHVGPMARTVGDAALLLETLAGYDPDDPASIDVQSRNFTSDLTKGVRDLRVGIVTHFHESDIEADPEVRTALEIVANVLAREGAHVKTAVLPPLNEFVGVNRTIVMSEAWNIHAPWLRERPADYSSATRSRLMAGAFLSADDYVQAQRNRKCLVEAVNSAFRHFDVLVTASGMDPPCRIDDEAEISRTSSRQARLPFNVTGHPALAMASGISESGLPLSVQFVGRHFEDGLVLQAAFAYEQATDWHLRLPQRVSQSLGKVIAC